MDGLLLGLERNEICLAKCLVLLGILHFMCPEKVL